MRNLAAISALAMLGLMTSAHAEITGTAAVTSDYDFRGVSLSEEDPAFQASIDYAHDNGFYASIWGSNIDYGSDYDGTIEIDLSAGLAGAVTPDRLRAVFCRLRFHGTGLLVRNAPFGMPVCAFNALTDC